MAHLFRPLDPPNDPTPPVGARRRILRAVAAVQSLARAGRPLLSQRLLRTVRVVGLWALLLADVVSLLVLAYMIDLCLSLMELWAELARKHLEIMLS